MTEEVDEFLAAFHSKMNIWDVVFNDDRGKNIQALLDLEITPVYRKKILSAIERIDYSQGPNIDNQWVFGKKVNGTEVYIKIALGFPGTSTICISFHPAERQMTYPLKQ